MAKVNIKSEKITPFGGIFHVRELFSRYVAFWSLWAPLKQEGEVVRAIGVDGVLRQRALSPGVDTPYSMDVEVDVQIDKTATLDIGRMTGLGIKILLTIVPGSDAEGLTALNVKSALVVTYLEPTDITTIAIILRMDVLSLVFGERHLIEAEESATLGKRIRMPTLGMMGRSVAVGW